MKTGSVNDVLLYLSSTNYTRSTLILLANGDSARLYFL